MGDPEALHRLGAVSVTLDPWAGPPVDDMTADVTTLERLALHAASLEN